MNPNKIYLFILLLTRHITTGFVQQTTTFQTKLTFLTHFLSENHGPVDLYTSWLPRQQKELFKQLPNKQLRFMQLNNLDSKLDNFIGIEVYDFSGYELKTIPHLKNQKNMSIVSQKLILINDQQGNDVFLDAVLESFDILPDRSALVAKLVFKHGYVQLSNCYKLIDSLIVKDYLLTWSQANNAKQQLSIATLKSLNKVRINFRGIKMPVAMVLSDPKSMNHIVDLRYQSIDTFSKVNYGPIVKLFNFYNITPTFTVFKDYQFIMHGNMSKYLLSVTAPYMTSGLLPQVNFMRVIAPPKLCFVMRRLPTSFVTTIFTIAFTPGVWYATLGILVLFAMALYMLLNFESRRKNINGKAAFSLSDSLLIVLEAICQQGTSTDPRSYASRTIQIFTFMAFMFLFVSYSANLFGLLQSTTPLHNLQQLLDYGIDYGGMKTDIFQYYNEETANDIFARKINATKRYGISEGMERVRSGLFAFFIELPYGEQYAKVFLSDDEVCRLQEFAGGYDYSLGYSAISKTSGYYELFKVALLRIAETGIADRHYSQYFLPPRCYSTGSSYDAIGIREIYQAILLVAMGVTTSTLLFIFELVLHRIVQGRKNSAMTLLVEGIGNV